MQMDKEKHLQFAGAFLCVKFTFRILKAVLFMYRHYAKMFMSIEYE